MILMITRKDLAPIDDKSLELWRKKLKLIKDKTLRDLYVFSRDFYAWPCRNHYKGVSKMTIHDILVNCGSVQSDTSIIILDDNEVKWLGTFMNLPKEYEYLKFKYFTISVMVHKYTASAYFKFYV